MLVKQIIKCGKSRSIVKLESGLSFPLYSSELNKFDTKEGEDLSDGSLDIIMTQILPSRCIKRAMNLLQKKSFAEGELVRKLTEGGYPEEVIDKAVEYVRSYGYIDDVRYASDYIRYHSSQGRGRNRIRAELLQKGISDADFEKAWNETEELGLIEDSSEAIDKLLQKKHFSPDMDISERNKIAAFIMRRGYSSEDIFRRMREYEGN
ncbi:MAG: regulatory protein RecX [Lachnospiraceae bacterium]|nr:regulatory protein RecX [Lachnospiraceae bacterium]MBP1585101.1 regulatory protein RecX [Lachnospiraceae bacterium]